MSEDQLKQRTAKGLMWGAIGNGTLQVCNLVFGVFLSRLLSPSDYGVIGALTFFSAMAGILTESGFILAIVNKRKVGDEDYNTVFWFNVCAGLVLYTALCVLAGPIASFYHTPEMEPVARFLFLGFLAGGLSAAPAAYFMRNLMVKERSMIQMIAILISGCTGVTLAFCGWGYWGLAVQSVLYSAANSVMLWIWCPWRPRMSFSMASLRSMLPFSSRQLLTSIFNHFNNNFFAVLLGRFYGMRLTGFYNQGNKWTTMGYSTLHGMIQSVGQPVMRQTADDNQRLQRVFHKMLRFTAFVSFPAMFGLAIVSRELIVLAITDKWLEAVPVMHILCVGGAFLPISTLYANLMNSINRPNVFMWNTISLGVLQLACLCLSYQLGLSWMLRIYVSINVLWLFVWQMFASRYAGISLWDVLRDVLPYLLLAIAVMTATLIVTSGIGNLVLSLTFKVVLAAVLYVTVLWAARSAILLETFRYVFRR